MNKTSLLNWAVMVVLYGVASMATAQQAAFERTALDDYIAKPNPNFSYIQ